MAADDADFAFHQRNPRQLVSQMRSKISIPDTSLRVQFECNQVLQSASELGIRRM